MPDKVEIRKKLKEARERKDISSFIELLQNYPDLFQHVYVREEHSNIQKSLFTLATSIAVGLILSNSAYILYTKLGETFYFESLEFYAKFLLLIGVLFLTLTVPLGSLLSLVYETLIYTKYCASFSIISSLLFYFILYYRTWNLLYYIVVSFYYFLPGLIGYWLSTAISKRIIGIPIREEPYKVVFKVMTDLNSLYRNFGEIMNVLGFEKMKELTNDGVQFVVFRRYEERVAAQLIQKDAFTILKIMIYSQNPNEIDRIKYSEELMEMLTTNLRYYVSELRNHEGNDFDALKMFALEHTTPIVWHQKNKIRFLKTLQYIAKPEIFISILVGVLAFPFILHYLKEKIAFYIEDIFAKIFASLMSAMIIFIVKNFIKYVLNKIRK